MYVSTLLTSLPMPVEEAIPCADALCFRHVDVVAVAERPATHREALAEAGVTVACAAVGRGLPEGHTLDAASVEARRAALDVMKRQVADAAQLGATHCYIIPGLDISAEALKRFAEACCLLADFAAGRMVQLCVEHIPGRALPTAAGTLRWLNELGHDNLSLLLDVGHCLITNENAADVIRQAGNRLGYVHFDDNDGQGDLHWPLLTGKLARTAIEDVFAALRSIGYDGAVSLELIPKDRESALQALGEGRHLLQGMLGPEGR